MKNLTATFSAIYRDEFANPAQRITATAIDPETDSFFAARERVDRNEEVVEVEIIKGVQKHGEYALEVCTARRTIKLDELQLLILTFLLLPRYSHSSARHSLPMPSQMRLKYCRLNTYQKNLQ